MQGNCILSVSQKGYAATSQKLEACLSWEIAEELTNGKFWIWIRPAVRTIISLWTKIRVIRFFPVPQRNTGKLLRFRGDQEDTRISDTCSTAAIATTLANPAHREQQAAPKSLGAEPREGTLRQGLHKS